MTFSYLIPISYKLQQIKHLKTKRKLKGFNFSIQFLWFNFIN